MSPRLCLCVTLTLPLVVNCGRETAARPQPQGSTLTVGLGAATATTGTDDAGLGQIANLLSADQLFNFEGDGMPTPVIASDWSYSADGLKLTIGLRETLFHDGSPVTAPLVADLLKARLPRTVGPVYDDIEEIRAESERELAFILKRPSRFVTEALDVAIQKPGSPTAGTGPFRLDDRAASTELVANPDYSLGKPGIGRIVLKPYPSVRAAWAELLRGNVDMLYEVGADALPSLEPSTRARVFSYRRHYQYVVMLNLRRSALREASVRRDLNAAIDRGAIITEGLASRGTPSQGPIWPGHWAAPPDLATIAYAPRRLADAARPIRLACLLVDPSHERLGVALQRQLRSVGVDLDLQFADNAASALRRIFDGDFDVALFEVISAPTILRPYLFWHSKGPYNYGGYASQEVDAALDSIRHAEDDDAYKAGVAAFQRAVMNDPPAIFLAWGERARAISTAFDVQVEPGRDPLSTIREWRPVGPAAVPSSN